jgi:hypothetical protein
MTRLRTWRPFLAAAGLSVVLGSCGELDVSNPNAPERERAFSDPATIVAAAGGTVKTFVNTRWAYRPSLTMTAMADSYTASWNNYEMRYYSSYNVDCPNRCGWVNAAGVTNGLPVEVYWYGMYSAISSANDALFAIRLAAEPPDLGNRAAETEVVSQLVQGASHALLALTYDRAFVVEEDKDTPEELAALELLPRAEVRDAAVAQLEKAVTLGKAGTFTTDISVFGGEPRYTGKQLAKIARTLQAEALALFPRSSEENSQVNWAKVAEYASQGISSNVDGPPFDFTAYTTEAAFADGYNERPSVNGIFSGFSQWGNDYTTVRVDTRVARLLATNQLDPWPGGNGNPKPNASIWGVVDKRVGDGCLPEPWGEDDLFGVGECGPSANAGTDFVWSPVAIFNPTRGSFHQSNIGYIRHHCLVGIPAYPDCPTGAGLIPLMTTQYNDLLWAEGLIRSNGDLALAAQLINNSRVGRGGLPPVSAANTQTELLAALIYEQEIEHMPIAFAMFANRRRETKASGAVEPPAYNNIWPGTPRQMPIPAKDLSLLKQELYTFGGADNPSFAAGTSAGAGRVRNVREIYAALLAAGRGPKRQ